MVEHTLQRTKVFLKNRHISFIGPYHPTSLQQGKVFICTTLYVLVGNFILILKKCINCVYRMGSSQCSPRIMRAWERMPNFIILKKYGFKG